MAQLFRERLAYAKAQLAAAPRDDKDRVSSANVRTLQTLLAEFCDTLTMEQKVRLSAEIMAGAFATKDLDRKNKQQGLWPTIVPKISMDTKLQIIISKLIELGGRKLSEPTKEYASVFWMAVTDSLQLSHQAKKGLRDRFSNALLNILKKTARSTRVPEFKPLPSPAHLKAKHPDIWQHLFPTEEPVPCQIDEKVLIVEDAMHKCRPRDGMHAPMDLTPPGGLQHGQIQAFGGFMMQRREARVAKGKGKGQRKGKKTTPEETVRPKHHWMHHIPVEIAKDKWVADAFTMERLHLVVKKSSITQTLKEASCEDQC